MQFHDMDIAHMNTNPRIPIMPRLERPAPIMTQLPSYDAKTAHSKGLLHWARNQRRSFWLTCAFMACVFALEIAGLWVALMFNIPLPDPLHVSPAIVTPAIEPQCVHETVYIDASGNQQAIGIDEICH